MVIKDIIKYVHKFTGTEDNILEVIDEVNSFMLENMPNLRWQFIYNIDLKYGGTATASAATMTDNAAAFATDGSLIGQTILNVTDGSSAVITAATATKITGVLTGGTANTWVSGNSYTITIANDIHIPKTINSIDAVFVDTARIFGTVPLTSLMNSTGITIDNYSQTNGVQQETDQGVAIRDDYVMEFIVDIDGDTLKLLGSKMSNEVVYEDIALNTEMDLPNKFTPTIAFFVASRLFLYQKYYNEKLARHYKGQFEESYASVKLPLGREKISRLNLGKRGGQYDHQNHITI